MKGNQVLAARKRLQNIGLSDSSNDYPRGYEGFFFNSLSYGICGGQTCC